MPRVVFTPNLAKHVNCPPQEVPGDTVRAVLDHVFSENPVLRGYVLDDQARLRHHVVVFVGGEQVLDRTGLSDPVPERAEVYVMQALSGG
ncbi:MAG: sulfur-carrier protein [Chloroflexota bacterium]|nr:sulfur-carrier protein [Chloroflexota bacterium]